ncbi:MAG: hypothetical protein Q4B47_02015 [Eubacteriales bacterium]|nr:hypothetical protein [Eubacteriales bacterium]
MKNRKLLSMMLTAALTLSMSGVVHADELENAQAQRNTAANALAAKQNEISTLETKKQELETYLQQINQQYVDLEKAVTDLSVQMASKEEELKTVHSDLETAQNASQKQYDNMKLRIQYIYEHGGSSYMQRLLSSKDMGDFINTAVSIMEISDYDREQLTKYENLQTEIQEKEAQVKTEKTEIESMMTERSAAKQEMQNLVQQTNTEIASYVSQISSNQAEADALMAEVNSADSRIAALTVVAESYHNYSYNSDDEEEYSDAESDDEESYEEEADDSDYEEEYDDSESNYEEESYEEESDDSDYEESYEEEADDSDEEESYDYDNEMDNATVDEDIDDAPTADDSSDSGDSSASSGKYLGNFTLTAYCNCASCCGTAGNLTASGTVPTAGNTIAMGGVDFGTQLMINGHIYTVEDRGTGYGHVDIYMDSHDAALAFGLQSADVYLVG